MVSFSSNCCSFIEKEVQELIIFGYISFLECKNLAQIQLVLLYKTCTNKGQ